MTVSIPDIIKRSPVFSSLNTAELDRLAGISSIREFPAGSFVSHSGDLWQYLFLVIEGRLNVLKESIEGRSLVVAELGPEQIFWGSAFFQTDFPNPMTLQVLQPAVLCLWQREDMLPFLLEKGGLSWELSKLMMARMLHASEVIDGLAFQPVAGRLARLLMDFPGQGLPGPIARSLTLDEMAARIGSTREMVCRFLQKFADDGMIKITRTEFEITDRVRLTNMAQKEKT